MKATVVHDENGRIIAITKAVDLQEAGSKFTRAGIIPGPGQYALDMELTGELERMRLLDIHRSHLVDRVASKLVRAEHSVSE